MKGFFTLLFSISFLLNLEAQNLEETYEVACDCWTVTNYYDNGQVSSVHHENNARKKDGDAVVYGYEGQKVRYEHWVNGRLDGTATHYHPDGSIYLEATYENGKKKGRWLFREPDGTPSQEIIYSGNGSDGIYVLYYAGVKYVEQTIENGKLVNTNVVHQELYDIVQEESSQTTK